MSTLDKLAAMNVTVDEARDYIYTNVGNAKSIFDAAQSGSLTAGDLANIVQLSEAEVVDYFSNAGLDVAAMHNQRTDVFMVSALSSGNVWAYDPSSGNTKALFSFNTTITDIASHYSGDIYGISFDRLYKFDVATQTTSLVARTDYGSNALDIRGDLLYIASSTNSAVEIRDLNGMLLSEHNLPGGTSAGDISIIGNSLFRTTVNGIYETSLVTGATHLEIGSIGAKYHGLAKGKDDVLAGFGYDGEVKGYNPVNGAVIDNLPDIRLVGYDLSGATQMLQMHLTM